MTPAYFAKVRPTYIENWSDALLRLSIRQTGIPLDAPEARALSKLNESHVAAELDAESRRAIDQLTDRLAAALRNYPEGAFVRLGSRSCKDSRFARRHGLRIFHASDALSMLTGDSRRLAFDLRLALRFDYRPHIFVRQWHVIPAWAEFRCFMRRRKLVGVSQYDCRNLGHCPPIAQHSRRIKAAIELFFDKVVAASHLDDAVCDVFLDTGEEQLHQRIDVRLLELNPFIPQTDPCLFNWSGDGDFDGSFRFL